METRLRGILKASKLLTCEHEYISLPETIIKALEWKIGDVIKIDIIKAGIIHQVVIAKDEATKEEEFYQIEAT